MALPAFRSIGAGVYNAATISVVWPTHGAGDLAFLVVRALSAITAPAGWNTIYSGTHASAYYGFYWKIAESSSESSVSVSASSGLIGAIIVFTGEVDNLNPHYLSYLTVSSSISIVNPYLSPGYTPGGPTKFDGTVVVYMFSFNGTGIGDGQFSSLAALTERLDYYNVNVGNIAIVSGTDTVAGTIGETSFTVGGSTRSGVVLELCISKKEPSFLQLF